MSEKIVRYYNLVNANPLMTKSILSELSDVEKEEYRKYRHKVNQANYRNRIKDTEAYKEANKASVANFRQKNKD